MAFGSVPVDVSNTPLGSVAVPNTAAGDLTALEGGPASTDTNSNKTAPASIYIKDGNDVTQGLTTDAAVTGDTGGTLSAKIRGLVKIFTDIWDSVNHRLGVADIEAANYIALTSPPTQTNAASNTTLTFSSQVNRVIIQNNTSANVNVAFDATATVGSLVIVPGVLLVYPKKITAVHLYTAAAQNINGTSAGNIIVLGAL